MTAYIKKQDLIETLKNNYGKQDEELKGLSRDELYNMLNSLHSNLAANSLDNAEIIPEDVSKPIIEYEDDHEKENEIFFGSPKWSDFVMEQFVENTELINGMPTCDGLRRVFQNLIGPIINTDITVIKAPNGQDPTATVKCEISYLDCRKFDPNNFRHSPFLLGRETCSVSDVFDVTIHNTPYPWHLASVATAATKAEARALRKGLGLQKVLSQEEVTQGFDSVASSKQVNSDGKEKLGDAVKVMIKATAGKIGVDLSKLLASLDIKYSIDEIDKESGLQIMNILQEYLRNIESIPDNIKSDLNL